MDRSRKIECHGPCDEYGDPKPDGVARIGFWHHAYRCDHHIIMDYAEAKMLHDELDAALRQVALNRRDKLTKRPASEPPPSSV